MTEASSLEGRFDPSTQGKDAPGLDVEASGNYNYNQEA